MAQRTVYQKHRTAQSQKDDVFRMWLGEEFAGSQEWKGRSTDTKVVSIPMAAVAAEPQDKNLIIQKEGKGRLYYRIGLNYAPLSLELKAVNYGFKVERKYDYVDEPGHVTKDKDGIWHFKLSHKVKITLTMTTNTRRYHVALCDYMPAGIEALNPALKGTISGAPQSSVSRNPYRYRWYDRFHWPEHQNLRDERAEAFRSLLWEGVYEWSYMARATTLGKFVVPPAYAEEMYSPENFGRCATERVIVEE